jgi:hypothetical protein
MDEQMSRTRRRLELERDIGTEMLRRGSYNNLNLRVRGQSECSRAGGGAPVSRLGAYHRYRNLSF